MEKLAVTNGIIQTSGHVIMDQLIRTRTTADLFDIWNSAYENKNRRLVPDHSTFTDNYSCPESALRLTSSHNKGRQLIYFYCLDGFISIEMLMGTDKQLWRCHFTENGQQEPTRKIIRYLNDGKVFKNYVVVFDNDHVNGSDGRRILLRNMTEKDDWVECHRFHYWWGLAQGPWDHLYTASNSVNCIDTIPKSHILANPAPGHFQVCIIDDFKVDLDKVFSGLSLVDCLHAREIVGRVQKAIEQRKLDDQWLFNPDTYRDQEEFINELKNLPDFSCHGSISLVGLPGQAVWESLKFNSKKELFELLALSVPVEIGHLADYHLKQSDCGKYPLIYKTITKANWDILTRIFSNASASFLYRKDESHWQGFERYLLSQGLELSDSRNLYNHITSNEYQAIPSDTAQPEPVDVPAIPAEPLARVELTPPSSVTVTDDAIIMESNMATFTNLSTLSAEEFLKELQMVKTNEDALAFWETSYGRLPALRTDEAVYSKAGDLIAEQVMTGTTFLFLRHPEATVRFAIKPMSKVERTLQAKNCLEHEAGKELLQFGELFYKSDDGKHLIYQVTAGTEYAEHQTCWATVNLADSQNRPFDHWYNMGLSELLENLGTGWPSIQEVLSGHLPVVTEFTVDHEMAADLLTGTQYRNIVAIETQIANEGDAEANSSVLGTILGMPAEVYSGTIETRDLNGDKRGLKLRFGTGAPLAACLEGFTVSVVMRSTDFTFKLDGPVGQPTLYSQIKQRVCAKLDALFDAGFSFIYKEDEGHWSSLAAYLGKNGVEIEPELLAAHLNYAGGDDLADSANEVLDAE